MMMHHNHQVIKDSPGRLKQKSKAEKIEVAGKILSGLFSVSCGATNANALLKCGLPTFLSMVLAPILFFAVTFLNFSVFKQAIPKTLKKLFGNNNVFKNKAAFSKRKKILLGIGFFLSISAGSTFGALATTSILSLLAGLTFLSFVSPIFLPIAILFGVLTFFSMFSLMFEAMYTILEKSNLLSSGKKFLDDLLNFHPRLPQDQNKSVFRVKFERIATLFLTLTAFSLAGIGLYMTMGACSVGLNNILAQIPHVSTSIAKSISQTFCYGFAFMAQAPFTFQTALKTAHSAFNPTSTENVSKKSSMGKGGFFLTRLLSGIGNGLIAMQGADSFSTQLLAGTGGAFNTFSSAVGANNDSQTSTGKIFQRLSQENSSFIFSHPFDREPFLKKTIVPLKPRSSIELQKFPINREKNSLQPTPFIQRAYSACMSKNI